MINLLMWEHEMKKKSKNRDFYFLELVDFSGYCRLYSTVTIQYSDETCHSLSRMDTSPSKVTPKNCTQNAHITKTSKFKCKHSVGKLPSNGEF